MVMNKKKIAIITTVGLSLDKLYPDFYPVMKEEGFEVVGICAEDKYVENVRKYGVRVITVPMKREISPFSDFFCLLKLCRIFHKEKFDLINYSTPKAAFLSALAGRLARCPRLLYTCRGIVFDSFSGFKKRIVTLCEKVACRCAHKVVAISPTLKEHMVSLNLLNHNKIYVLGKGSSKGVDIERFSETEDVKEKSRKIKRILGIDDDSVVYGYAGRLTIEKGIVELIKAFECIQNEKVKVHLVIIGDQDERLPLPNGVIRKMADNKFIHTVGFQADVVPYICLMDIFVMPSYREGFGNVLIEAGALGIVSITSDIPGCRDAIKDGETGILVPPRDVVKLKRAMLRLLENYQERREMGINARNWVHSNFDRGHIWSMLINYYKKMLAK